MAKTLGETISAQECVFQVSELTCTYPRHVLHKDRKRSFMCVPQAAIVLNNALMEKIFQQLNLTLQSTHLLNTHTNKVQKFTRHQI